MNSTATLKEFSYELETIRREVKNSAGAADIVHLRKVVWAIRLSSLVGYALAWIYPNPLSLFLISFGRCGNWTMLGHHIGHKGYDGIDNVPQGYRSNVFAKAWRRYVDWLDWLEPQAWEVEHNRLHHYKLGEQGDPDNVELNLTWLRESKIPVPFRYLIVAVLVITWKFTYYAPTCNKALWEMKNQLEPTLGTSPKWWNPMAPEGRRLWLKCYFPYILVHFCLLPLLFLPLGSTAVWYVLINSLLAEVCTNIHSFLIVVTNHAGPDLYRFDKPMQNKEEFYLRQIVGSSNHTTGGFLNDLMHGFLNYQIEHHLWPSFSMLQYQKAQPQVKALCAKYGIPYAQEPLWARTRKTLKIMVGTESMKLWNDNEFATFQPNPITTSKFVPPSGPEPLGV